MAANLSNKTMMYQCQYCAINSRISECDHNRETRKPQLQIGNKGSSQTQQNAHADVTRYGCGLPTSCWSGVQISQKLNWIVFEVWTRIAGWLPRPVVTTKQCHTVESGISVPWKIIWKADSMWIIIHPCCCINTCFRSVLYFNVTLHTCFQK